MSNNKVRAGEPVAISASVWNRVVDQIATKPRLDGLPGDALPINHRVRVENKSGTGVDRWAILAITGVLEAPVEVTGISGVTGAYGYYETWPGVVGVTPGDTTEENYVVTLEPIEADRIGMAAIGGVVQARLEVTNENHRFASPKPGCTNEMRTASSGNAAVLWRATGSGTGVWSLVRMGGRGEGIRLGKISGTWEKEATATVWEFNGDGTQKVVSTGCSGATAASSLTGVNRFATVPASGASAKWVALGIVDSTWHLIAAEC